MDLKTLEELAPAANDSPENAMKYLLDCLLVFQEGEDKAMGYLGYVLSKNDCNEDRLAPSGYVPTKRWQQLIKDIRGKPNCIIAAMGASWEDDYKGVDPDNYNLQITRELDEGGHLKTFIKSGGRDNPFPIKTKQNSKGKWKVTDGLGSICMTVRKPKSEVDDF